MKIVFFDGNCPMCHSWVKRMIKWDKNKMFRFSPLESETAQRILQPIFPDYLKEDTIVYYNEGLVLIRSDAAFGIAKELGFPYNLASVGKYIPKKIRDAIYKKIASMRYRYGKRYNSCPLPPAEWMDRFIK